MKIEKLFRHGHLALTLGVVAVIAFLSVDHVQAQVHEYTKLTGERVEKALADEAKKADIKLAEASLTGLGWFVLYGNDEESAALAEKLNGVVSNAYNGTDKMDTVYMNHTSEAYSEMLNLNRFDKKNEPVSRSPEYTALTRKRVAAALADGAGPEEFRLAEGSLCALGWMTLNGSDEKSLALGTKLMNAASKAWPGAKEVYMLQTSTAYAEIINLGRFDVYDYDGARVVVHLDNKLEDENYVTFTKTLPIDSFGTSLEVTASVNEKEDYYTILFLTRGVDLGGTGLGNRAGLLPYCSDWDVRKEPQVIYATGKGLNAALEDLEKKFNGTQGRCSFSGMGDATKGQLVITMLGPVSVDAEGGAVSRPRSDSN